MKPFGWLNTLYDLATDGVFTKDGKDAIQSVKDEKLYKVLTMAFKKLREIRDRFEQEWINGGFIFGYENDINENHNNDYPLLVTLPPTSELPETEGSSKEDYTFECLIVKPYFQNHTGSLDVVFSLLEQEALTWLQRVLDRS